MRSFLMLIVAFWASLSIAANVEVPASDKKTIVRLGMLDFESEASYLGKRQNIQESIVDYLQAHSPGLQIIPRFYTTADLHRAIKDGEVEFFLGSSGFYVEMRGYGVRDIGTIISPNFPDPNRCVAGVMIARNDRTDLTDLASLKGRVAATTATRNFMTYMLNMGEIAKAGFDPNLFFSRVIETDNQPVAVMQAVMEGRADVGLLRACMPEAIITRHPEFKGRFKTLNDHPGLRADRLGCRYSTDMYPGWTFAAAPHTPARLTKHVAMTLLCMTPDSTPGGFTVSLAGEYDRVNALFRTLKIGPYEYLNHWTLERVWEEGRSWILLLIGLGFAWILHVVRLEKLVEKRTKALSEALVREQEIQEEIRTIGDKLDCAQRAGIVGQLSSIFAHELCQPLAAIGYYLRGLKTLIKKNDADPALVNRCLDGLTDELEDARRILDRVRSYAKTGANRTAPVDLPMLIHEALSDMRRSARLKLPVQTTMPEHSLVHGDALELRVLIINLLKNAAQAAAEIPDAELKLTLTETDTSITLRLENPGDLLTEAELAKLGRPLATTKSEGLGLGLLICKSIAEAHQATLSFEPRPADMGGGLTVRFVLPRTQDANPIFSTKEHS